MNLAERDRDGGDKHRVGRNPWQAALLTPLVTGALAWLWVDLTMSTSACALGDGGGAGETIGLIALMASAPVATTWRARRTGYPLLRTAAAVIVSAALGVLLVWVAYEVWWFGHNCYS
jgi:hypothetical protein